MKPPFRPYQTEDDFWRMREFLRRVFLLNDRLERSWHVARLDYARWHTCLNCANVRLEEVACLWEFAGQLIAFLMPGGGRGEAHFFVHPGCGYNPAASALYQTVMGSDHELYEPWVREW